MKRILFALAALILAGPACAAHNFCGELRNAFGPFDYRQRASHPGELDIVERVHFTPDVENGIKGNTGSIGADLNYTLRAWPNHHRALSALYLIAQRTHAVELPGGKYPVECWFDRAIRFAPDDGAVHAIYANFLYGAGKPDQANHQLEVALSLEPDNPVINYNAGLAYVKMKKYDQALACARKAYALGVPMPGLKKKLVEAGKWSDAPEAPPAQPVPDAPAVAPAADAPATPPAAGAAPAPAQQPPAAPDAR
jgi:hypothetical protein